MCANIITPGHNCREPGKVHTYVNLGSSSQRPPDTRAPRKPKRCETTVGWISRNKSRFRSRRNYFLTSLFVELIDPLSGEITLITGVTPGRLGVFPLEKITGMNCPLAFGPSTTERVRPGC